VSANSTGERSVAEALPELYYESVEVELYAKGHTKTTASINAKLNDTNEVKVEIEGIDPNSGLIEAITEIVTVSTAEATKLAAQIVEIEALVEAGTISEEEGEKRIEELEESFQVRMERFGESMEAWGEEFGEKMEDWGEEFSKKWEQRAEDLEKSIEDGVASELDIKRDFDQEVPEAPEAPEASKKKKSNKTRFDVFEFHLGSNSFRDASGNSSITDGMISQWESLGTRVVFGNKHKIGGASSPLVLQTGFAFETVGFSFTGDKTLVKVDPTTSGASATTEIQDVVGVTDIRRNRFDQTYFELPVMLHLDFSQRGKVDDSFSIGAGAFAGVRIAGSNLIQGSDSEGSRIQIRTNNDYNTHLFRFGLQGQLGYKSWKVTGRLDARTFFQEGAFNEDVYVGSLALGLSF
jgi:hypothetical protein